MEGFGNDEYKNLRSCQKKYKEEGKKEIAQISKLFVKEKKSPAEIAKEVDISEEMVKDILIELGYDLD